MSKISDFCEKGRDSLLTSHCGKRFKKISLPACEKRRDWLFIFLFNDHSEQLKKTNSIVFANRRLLQNFIIALFKINLIKKTKKKKRKKNRVMYKNAFKRMFIQIMTKFQRMKKEQKTQKILIKKKISQRQKSNVVIKKQIMIDNKIKHVAARVIKKTKKDEKRRKKSIESTESKVERNEEEKKTWILRRSKFCLRFNF